jgi:hypothetical protein
MVHYTPLINLSEEIFYWTELFSHPALVMAAIAKWRGPGLLAHTEAGFLSFVKLDLQAPERHAFNGFVFAIAKWLLFTQSACAP